MPRYLDKTRRKIVNRSITLVAIVLTANIMIKFRNGFGEIREVFRIVRGI